MALCEWELAALAGDLGVQLLAPTWSSQTPMALVAEYPTPSSGSYQQ